MSYRKEQKEETKKRILEAAGKSFKKAGYGGVGVDGLAKSAGVTSGAFYVHFKSKKEAFKASVLAGLREVQDAVAHLKKEHGKKWWSEFAKFYLNQKRTCDLNDSCALQSLSAEVARFDDETKNIYEQELKQIIELATSHTSEKEKVWANFAMLVGGVTLARAVNDEKLSKTIANAIEKNIFDLSN